MARTYVDKSGYRRFSDSGRLVHRWAAQKKVGGALDSSSVVHHKNRDKLDNRRGNIWVFGSQKEHDRTHKKDKNRWGVW